MKYIFRGFYIITLLLLVHTAFAQGLKSKQIDSLVEKTLKTFNVPGIAVAVIKDGKVIHSKGYGIRSIETNKKVDENTLFGVASNTKAFTAAALGMLVDEKKITWDTKVIDVLPEFKLYDSYVTREFTLRDLLTHRSGLGLGAGDLMIWPDSSTVSKSQMIHNLQFLKPVSSFRSKYDYDNLLYIVAGEVVERVSGKSYETFLNERFFEPLGMNKTAASWYRLKDRSNIITGHAPYEDKLLPVGLSFSEVANAAGGIYSNVVDMSKWVLALLNEGRYGKDLAKSLFSKEVHRALWTPQTITNSGLAYNARFNAYGLGFNLSTYDRYFQAMHTGGLAGIVSQVTMLPELNLGIIVLTNQQSGAAFNSISNTIKDAYVGITDKDRILQYNNLRMINEKEAKYITEKIWSDIQANQSQNVVDLKAYAGNFKDNWFGQVHLTLKDGKIYFQAQNSPKLRGFLTFYKANTFIVKWEDRSLDADAFLNFNLDSEGRASGFKMKAISPATDFSFDFQDLDFKLMPEALE